jgi:hypothetical protein
VHREESITVQVIIPAALAALILFFGGAVVSAHDNESAEERATLQNAKITLNEAIAAAEREVPGGKVIDAEVDFEEGVASYFIDIEKDGLQTVQVDTETRKALKVATEADDAGDHLPTAHRDDEGEDYDEAEDDD